MDCKKCGTTVSPDQRFCGGCGGDLREINGPKDGRESSGSQDIQSRMGDSKNQSFQDGARASNEQSSRGFGADSGRGSYQNSNNMNGQNNYQSGNFNAPSDQKQLSVLAHVLGLITGIIGPLILYLTTDDSKSFQKGHAREALNFQLTLLIAYFISGVLTIILIGFLGFIVFGIMDIIFCISAAIKANDMQEYRYPIAIRFLS